MAPHRARRLLGNSEEEARADDCLGQRGTRPCPPHQPTGKPSFHEASARQNSGGPSPVPGRGGERENQPRSADIVKLERDITGLVDRSTEDLRLAWRQVHRAEPPSGLSRDLLIRALAHQLQERTRRGASQALRHLLQRLTGELEKGDASFDPGVVLKIGTTLVRQWRGHAHTVLVRAGGFEYEGERYRSLTVIAERITGTHWSGPRFFGLTKRVSASVGAETGR